MSFAVLLSVDYIFVPLSSSFGFPDENTTWRDILVKKTPSEVRPAKLTRFRLKTHSIQCVSPIVHTKTLREALMKMTTFENAFKSGLL